MTVTREQLPDGRVKVTVSVTGRQLVAINELNKACSPAPYERPPRQEFDSEQWALGVRRILDADDAAELLRAPYNEIVWTATV